MNDFWRSLLLAWPYRVRLFLSMLCGFVVAFFWGANISAIYPTLTVLLERQTLLNWIDERIVSEEKAIHDLQTQIEEFDTQLREQSDDEIASRRSRRASTLESRMDSLRWSQWARPWIANVSPDDPFKTLCLLIGLLIAGMFIKGIFDFLQEYLSGQVVQLAVFDLRNKFYRQTMNLDLSYFDEKGTHDLMARFTSDVESLSGGMRALFGKVLFEPLKAISCLLFACFFNWRLTLFALLLLPASAVIMGLIGRYLKRMSRRNLESMSRMYKILQESFVGIRVVKAFTMEPYERRRFFRESRRYTEQGMKLIRTDAYGGPLLEICAVSAVMSALLAGAYLVLTGETHLFRIRLTQEPLESSKLLMLYGLILGMCDPLRKVFSVYGRVQRGVAAAERIFQCLDRVPLVRQKPRAPSAAPHSQSITFHGVHFAYNQHRAVLKGIDLEVDFGETIAIVGSTGCGKTTLVNLLPRFHDVAMGEVRIDGVDIRDVSLNSLRRQMGIVTQHTVLFDDTIFANIAYGKRRVDPAEVQAAAEAAYAHRFILELPRGYQTTIGEMGNTLSGGQRQRIALARAILRDPAILILDEATSSLDVESEALIHQALRKFTRGRTTFVVTHRLSTLDIADRIVVLTDGRIEAIGTHSELMKSSPTFRRLHEVQARSA